MSSFPSGGGGWTCSVCGAWVMSGSTHYCGTFRQVPSQPDSVAMALGRIEALLQQILRKLEGPTN